MPHARFFSPQLHENSQSIILDGPEFHHLAHVYRMKVGDPLELINGQGLLAHATIDRIAKAAASLTIVQRKQYPRPGHVLILGIALIRMNKLEWIVEKGVELGVTAFYLFLSDYSEKGDLSEHQMERLHLLMSSALKQSGQLYLPEIRILDSLEEVLLAKHDAFAFFGDTNPEALSLLSYLKKHPKIHKVCFLSGPEKGFSQKEIVTLKTHAIHGAKLAPQILRAETAPLAAASICSNYFLEI